jgi:phytoene desaturase
MPAEQVIVVGAGIAGLACAARLAAKGYGVTVFDKNDYPGGKLGLIKQGGYGFDRGPSLFTQAHLFDELFTDCGRDRVQYLEYEKLEEGTRYFWDDGTFLEAFPDREKLAAELQRALGISSDAVPKYLDRAADLYEHIGQIFLDQPLDDWRTWASVRVLKAFAHLRLPYLTQKLHQYNQTMLRHPKLVQLFDRFATYNGSDPYRCPAMLSTIAHLELTEGAYYPKGGMTSIPDAVYRLCLDLGVEFRLGEEVKRIIASSGAVQGVETNVQRYIASRVVSNSDVYFTYANLLQDQERARHWEQQERSSSGIVFYWGIKKTFPELGLHNIFFAEDYKAEFDALFRQRKVHSDPTVYVNITSKMETAHAPEGCENWFVLINAPASSERNEQAIQQTRMNVLRKLSTRLGTDMEQLIETEAILDPAGIETWTNSYAGALYGTASNTSMSAFARHPARSRKYKGLFFAGGTVHPGGGIPLCMRSGRLAADALVKSS